MIVSTSEWVCAEHHRNEGIFGRRIMQIMHHECWWWWVYTPSRIGNWQIPCAGIIHIWNRINLNEIAFYSQRKSFQTYAPLSINWRSVYVLRTVATSVDRCRSAPNWSRHQINFVSMGFEDYTELSYEVNIECVVKRYEDSLKKCLTSYGFHDWMKMYDTHLIRE